MGGLSGTGRAGMIGAASLAVTGAADVLLAVWSHQPWPPALASVLILVPGLYLAWKAVPGPGRLQGGRRAAKWNPAVLGVHGVVRGGPLPPYIRRPHDDLLDAVLDPRVAAGRLVVVRGGSSTGKTRAVYEAVARRRLAGWRLEYPLNAVALQELLAAGIGGGTVLWLGELRQYTEGEDSGAAALGRLARLLETRTRLIAVTTMWPEHWTSYMEAARARDGGGQDRAGTVGRLLGGLPDLAGADRIDPARGGVIDVPDAFSASELIAAARSGQVLADAADAAARAGHDGHLAQYLAGVPDLIGRFQGTGGNCYGQAVITAAMDAARLGCESLLPRALLLDAAPGYLSDPQRSVDTAWAGPALEWATKELRGTVRAVQPFPPLTGTGIAGYRPADYLDQHGRRIRRNQVGPAELWDALAAHVTTTADLVRLGQTAEACELYRYAAVLYTSAAAQGSANAAASLIRVLSRASPDSVSHAAQWATANVSLDKLWEVDTLLRSLREAGAGEAASSLASRAAAHLSLDNPEDVARLLSSLERAGADKSVAVLLARDPAAHVSLNDAGGVASLLSTLRKAGAGESVAVFLARDPAAHVSLSDASGVRDLLSELREARAGESVATLLARDPAAHVSLDFWIVGALVSGLREAGSREQADRLASRAASHALIDNFQYVAALVSGLREARAGDAACRLAGRAAAHGRMYSSGDVAVLLDELLMAGFWEQAGRLASRAAAHVGLDSPGEVAALLSRVDATGAGAGEAVGRLAGRAAAHASLSDARGVAALLSRLRYAGAGESVTVLLARDPAAHVSLSDARGVRALLSELREAGSWEQAGKLASRVANAAPSQSQSWTWQEPSATAGAD